MARTSGTGIGRSIIASTVFLAVLASPWRVLCFGQCSALTGPAAPYDLPASIEPVAIATGDFNEDGIPDIAICAANSEVWVLISQGSGAYVLGGNYGGGEKPVSIAVGDVNKDGHLDIVTADWSDNGVSVALGDGHGGFGASTRYPTNYPDTQNSSNPTCVCFGDFNGDGKVDLAVGILAFELDLTILNGDGTGAFGSPRNYEEQGATGAQAISAADLNHDGILDLLIANFSSGNVGVMLGHSDGSFEPTAPVQVGHQNINVVRELSGIAVGDFNHDGNVDFAVTDQKNFVLYVMLGRGDGSFATIGTDYAVVGEPRGLVAADFDGDGNLDLALVGDGPAIELMHGHGDGTFQSVGQFGQGNWGVGIALADMNQDCCVDLVTCNPDRHAVSTWFNSGGIGCATVPATVDGCVAESVTLHANSAVPPVSFAWQVELHPAGSGNWVDLTDGALPSQMGSVGTVAGSLTNSLTLNRLDKAAAGRYRCRESNSCGAAISNASTLAISTAPGDVNCDCIVNLNDLAALLAHFGMTGASYSDGDLDGNGVVDLSDLGNLLSHFGVYCL